MNLSDMNEPIFKAVFGPDWEGLPPIIKRHYANRPFSQDSYQAQGVLDVRASGPLKWCAPLFWLLRGVPPCTESQVPVTVYFESDLHSSALHFRREFSFKSRPHYQFHSRMLSLGGNQLVEIMRFGIAWRNEYHWRNDRVVLQHKGYALALGPWLIPLPVTWLLGKGYAEEIPVDDFHFDMFVEMTHPLWGNFYSYRGRFQMAETSEQR